LVRRKKSLRTKRTVDVGPVIIVFLIAILVLGLGALSSMPIEFVLGAFLVVVAVALGLLVRSMIRR